MDMLTQIFRYDGVTYELGLEVHMKHATPETLILTQPFYFCGQWIPEGFEWNGASSPNTPIIRYIAPKFYKNIKASLIHDWLCGLARNPAERKKADRIYYILKIHVERDSSLKSQLGYMGVRVGAFFGKGNSF